MIVNTYQIVVEHAPFVLCPLTGIEMEFCPLVRALETMMLAVPWDWDQQLLCSGSVYVNVI